MANIRVNKNEATASRRRVCFFCVDVTDGMTPETGEAGGQPEISVDGAAYSATGIGTLVAVTALAPLASGVSVFGVACPLWVISRHQSQGRRCPLTA
jgi:hypothetical protein